MFILGGVAGLTIDKVTRRRVGRRGKAFSDIGVKILRTIHPRIVASDEFYKTIRTPIIIGFIIVGVILFVSALF
ncbi:MAG: hypothetical protein HY664_08115 [Chloroflexi bacterium]|nr:hypothetical protein [Chloroflexota bacterium]